MEMERFRCGGLAFSFGREAAIDLTFSYASKTNKQNDNRVELKMKFFIVFFFVSNEMQD